MKNYGIMLTYLEPMEGYTILEADSEEAAQKKAEELFQNRRNVVIVEVKELLDEEQQDFGFDKRNLN